MIKVVYVDPVGGHAGMHYYDFALCSSLLKAGVDLTYVTCDETRSRSVPPDLPTEYLFKEIYGKKSALRRGSNYLRALKKIYKNSGNDTDLMHFHFFDVPLADYILLRKIKRRGTKIVITAHDIEPFKNYRFSLFWTNKFYRLADHVIVHARDNKEEIIRKFKLGASKVTVIPHGNYQPYTEKLVPGQGQARQRLGLGRHDQVLLFFGQIKKVKGLEYLLRALPLVLERFPNTVLLVAGEARQVDFSNYLKLISDLGIEGKVIVRIQYIPDEEVPYYFHAADAVILPYLKIYQSGVLLMASSFGRPVIATDLGGMRETLVDGETGYLVPPRDSQKLAAAINRLLADKDRAEAMGRKAKELVEKEFSWDAIAQKTKEVYEFCIRQNR